MIILLHGGKQLHDGNLFSNIVNGLCEVGRTAFSITDKILSYCVEETSLY